MNTFATSNVNYLKQNANKLIIFFGVYLLGIILGVFFLGSSPSQSILYANAKNYHVIIFSSNVSITSAFFKCFFAGVLLSLITILLGINVYCIAFISIIILYRGIVLGTAFIIFYSISGISGVIISIILTFPVNLIITAGLIVASVLNYKNSKCNLKSRLILATKNAFISILFTLVASIYLVFIMITIIRPINLLF